MLGYIQIKLKDKKKKSKSLRVEIEGYKMPKDGLEVEEKFLGDAFIILMITELN